MMKLIERLFNEHKFARRFALFWAIWLITLVVLRVTEKVTEINGHVATIVLGVIGILATVIGFYQWSRQNDDEDHDISHGGPGAPPGN